MAPRPRILLLALLPACGAPTPDTAGLGGAAAGKADASTWEAQCDVTVTRPTGWFATHQCVVEGDATGTSLLPVTGAGRTLSTFDEVSLYLTRSARGDLRLALGQQIVTARLNAALFQLGDHPWSDLDGDGTTDTVDEVIADAEVWYDLGTTSERAAAKVTLKELNSVGLTGGLWFDEACAAPPEICDGADNDGDGSADEDCACVEVCDGEDNDVDGSVDEDQPDGDGDGYACDDCDDSDAAVFPGATEVENGVDDNCDGRVDEGSASYDDDGDGYSENAGDCEDADASISPAATEVCDGVDEDCDGRVDDGVSSKWYYDGDGDGWGASIRTAWGCTEPSGYTAIKGDCNDKHPLIHPLAGEVCGDGIDNDCAHGADDGC